MLAQAKRSCDYLICALHDNPSVERGSKNRPINSLEERRLVLSAIKYVDEVVVYSTEEELITLLKNKKPDVRILGDDYISKSYTGKELEIPIVWIDRNSHAWSTSGLREKIWQIENEKRGHNGK
jgi:glycerol-3-phosphate cytidylyltransferase